MSDQKNFKQWHILKEQLHGKEKEVFFHEREVWFCHIGCNVGYEQDGKGERFLRPVLILTKFNKTLFLGIPLTSKAKDGRHYFTFPFHNKPSTAILSQVRLFDARRLKRCMGEMDASEFKKLKRKCRQLFL